MPTPEDVYREMPHLLSPMNLARVDTNGKFQRPPHIRYMNEALMDAWFTPNARLDINLPFGHGKSWLSSQYFPAWVLLNWPDTRILLASYEEKFSATFGAKVKDVLERWGGPLGITLRHDTKAKNEWKIANHEGGMVCKGLHGSINGRPSDLLLLDDTVKDAEQAMSPSALAHKWDWYQTVAFSRLGPTAPIINVGTRWAKNDLFGRTLEESRRGGGYPFRRIVFKAIAGRNDVLGRKPGEALWPERVPLERLEFIRRERGRWFQICWQQEPADEESAHFRPRGWPRWADLGGAYSLESRSAVLPRSIYFYHDCTRFVAVDWAGSKTGKGKGNNYNCFIVAAITPDARVLILDVFNKKLRIEESSPALQQFCRRWEPAFCAVEDDMLSLAKREACALLPGIPEFRVFPIQSANKLARAAQAILLADNDKIYLPEKAEWLEDYCHQLINFTGFDDDQDDQADATGIVGRCLAPMQPQANQSPDYGAICLTPPPSDPYDRFMKIIADLRRLWQEIKARFQLSSKIALAGVLHGWEAIFVTGEARAPRSFYRMTAWIGAGLSLTTTVKPY